MASTLDPELIRIYRSAAYRVAQGAASFDLRIDQPSAELADWYRQASVTCAGLLTAWNPLGQLASRAANDIAQGDLRSELELLGLAMIEARGQSDDQTWYEDSLLVPGLDQARAAALGRKFGQNAIVWAGGDATPRLILLR